MKKCHFINSIDRTMKPAQKQAITKIRGLIDSKYKQSCSERMYLLHLNALFRSLSPYQPHLVVKSLENILIFEIKSNAYNQLTNTLSKIELGQDSDSRNIILLADTSRIDKSKIIADSLKQFKVPSHSSLSLPRDILIFFGADTIHPEDFQRYKSILINKTGINDELFNLAIPPMPTFHQQPLYAHDYPIPNCPSLDGGSMIPNKPLSPVLGRPLTGAPSSPCYRYSTPTNPPRSPSPPITHVSPPYPAPPPSKDIHYHHFGIRFPTNITGNMK